jgi:hypothetical protein
MSEQAISEHHDDPTMGKRDTPFSASNDVSARTGELSALRTRPDTGDGIVIPPEVAFERFLRDKHNRHEDKYTHISERVAVEELPPAHLYRWFSEWTNRQLADIGVNSTAGVALPPLHFELVRVNGSQSAAHTFESEGISKSTVQACTVGTWMAQSGQGFAATRDDAENALQRFVARHSGANYTLPKLRVICRGRSGQKSEPTTAMPG